MKLQRIRSEMSDGFTNPSLITEILEIDNGDGSLFAFKADETLINVGPQTRVGIKWEPGNRVIGQACVLKNTRIKLGSSTDGFVVRRFPVQHILREDRAIWSR